MSKAIAFLAAVAVQERHRGLFESNEALSSICERVVVPNMVLRERDIEAFEDDSMGYIRADLEGSGEF